MKNAKFDDMNICNSFFYFVYYLLPKYPYVARNATIFKNNHKGDRAFGSILHRRPVRPDSRFLSRSLFTNFEINLIIILPGYTNSNTDIDTGERKFNSY